MICVFREVSYSNYLFCTKIIKRIYSNLCAEGGSSSPGPNTALWLIIKNAGGAGESCSNDIELIIPSCKPAADEEMQDGGRTVFVETSNGPPRDLYIKRGDAEKHGCTRGCAGRSR